MYRISEQNRTALKKANSTRVKRVKKKSSCPNAAQGQFNKKTTDNMLTEGTLRASEKKYRTLVENLPQKIFHKDRNSVYVSCNRNYADDLKIKPEEIVGKTDYDFYPKALADKYRADDRRVMERGATETIEESYVHYGKKVIIQTVKAPIRDAENNITGILGIFWDITDRKKLEQTLIQYQRTLKALASQISSIEEKEREKCAAFLHDNIGQSLLFLKVKLAILGKSITPGESKAAVNEMLTTVDHLIKDTRFLTSELMPPMVYQLGLSAGIEWLVEQMNKRESIKIQFEDDGQPKPLNKNVSIMLFRSVQELLMNIIKHAKAQKAIVTFARNRNKVQIIVEDDGVGFNTAKRYSANTAGKGFGLFSIENRLDQLGGKFTIISKLNQGTRASLLLPLKNSTNRKADKTSYAKIIE